MPQPTAVAVMSTTQGDIVLNLFGDHAPKTVANFVELATGEREWCTRPRVRPRPASRSTTA